MQADTMLISILMFACAYLCGWVLYLDGLVEDQKGYMARKDKECQSLLDEIYECENNPDFHGHRMPEF